MAIVSIHLDSNNIEADVLTVAESGQSFIVLRLDDTVSLFIAGYDDESVVGARAIAGMLVDAADQIRRELLRGSQKESV